MFFSGFRPVGEVLFFAPPKKSTQKKGVPDGLPADAGSLRFSRSPALAQLAVSLRESRSNRAQASSGLHCDARLRQRGNSTPKIKTTTPDPSALTEYRSHAGIRRAPCLSVASCARPRYGEERRASALADECAGCPSLWVLSLGQARESISPRRAKPGDKKCTFPEFIIDLIKSNSQSLQIHKPKPPQS